VIVPGFIGARSVKWLSRIHVAAEPTPNYFQKAYSQFPQSMTAIPAGNDGGRVIGEFPLSSAFGAPTDNARVAAGDVTVRGWAIAGGERTVACVEVSCDGGRSWTDAKFISPATPFVWRLWEATCRLEAGTHVLRCRAFDSDGNSQPETPAETWNVKGYLNNCVDAITVQVA
jgi:sulfite oxidase